MSQKNTSLTLVGLGIQFLSQLTTEAMASIQQADCVLFLSNEPAMAHWLQENNANSHSLEALYYAHADRLDAYHAITQAILSELDQSQHVCVAIYGHPTICAKPGLDAIRLAEQRNIPTFILPGISASDCLFAGLSIDPIDCGLLSYDATDLLIHKRLLDPRSHLLLWQASMIGARGHEAAHDNQIGLTLLQNYLIHTYPYDHPITSFQAAPYPGMAPKIHVFPLRHLSIQIIAPTATLYLPPAQASTVDQAALNQLGFAR